MQTAEKQQTAAINEQDCPMSTKPQKEHEWLQQLVGEWTCEGEAAMGPDQPRAKWTATETVRSVGGLWILCEGKGEMPGGGASHTVFTIGFDPQQARFRATFVASMMGHLWVYEGDLDAAE